jgi:mono/diheme cytochrome c family protein
MLAIIGAMTLASFHNDADDEELAKRQAAAELRADRARELAQQNGVPVAGAADVFQTPPMWKARSIYDTRCKGCHDAGSKDRKGPIIGPGHGNRAWFASFLRAPSSEPYWGKTKLGHTENAMQPYDKLQQQDLDDLVELLYAQSGAPDVIPSKVESGIKLFKSASCEDCHAREVDNAGTSAPSLGGLGSRDYYTHFIGNPKSPLHMSEKSEMPRFDKELTVVERDLVAEYLVWLRTATQQDLDALGSL